jgi:hypothetical protein
LRLRKEETPLGGRGVSPTQLLDRTQWGTGVRGVGPVFTFINNLIKPHASYGSRRSSANSAMLTCYDFRNRTAREAWGCQATEDQNRKLNKRVRFNWNRNLEERVKFRYQVARPLTSFQFTRSEIVPHIDLLKVAKTTKLRKQHCTSALKR